MAEEQIGTQMVPPREGALCCGPAQEHLVTRLPPASHPGQGSMVRIRRKKLLASCLCVSATVFLLVTLQVVVELGKFEGKNFKNSNLKDGYAEMEKEPVPLHPFLKREGLSLNKKNTLAADSYPIMLWWSPLTGETGRLGQCGLDACFFTINRTYLHHQRTKALLFYGTDFNIDSLPLPRKAHHDWALFHEESPKNNYKLFHQPVITLFNYTATFSRHSHLPLTTQYLEGPEVLTSLQYLVPLQSKNNLRKSLAPLVYVQSDCDPPSDRDSYVRELMTYIEVDSYGECLRNRDLPQPLNSPASMDAEGFYRILAQYKFILAFENAVCDDYITEKFWRPLKLGVVPVYYGSPSIADWLPSNRSAILVSAFSHPRELASYIRRLDHDDRLYAAYLEWKLKGEISNHRLLTALRERKWGVQDITQENYIEAFECMVCTKVWENIRLQEKGLPPKTWKADVSHLSCPEPTTFAFSPLTRPRSSLREMWIPSFQQSKKEARALRIFICKMGALHFEFRVRPSVYFIRVDARVPHLSLHAASPRQWCFMDLQHVVSKLAILAGRETQKLLLCSTLYSWRQHGSLGHSVSSNLGNSAPPPLRLAFVNTPEIV